jgi:integrase
MSNQSRIPSYRLHKQSGQALVTLPDGFGSRRDVLLGRYGTQESRAEYLRVVSEWETNGRRSPDGPAPAGISVNELILAYFRFAETYYRKNDKPTSQVVRIQIALREVKELYGHTAATNFGPLALKAVRERMIRLGWTRGYINASVGCIKRMFKWGVENEIVPATVCHALQALAGLKKGRSDARETQRINPVADKHVAAVLPHLMPPVQGMVMVQRLTGMRPCEVILMRPDAIERTTEKTWSYRPEAHKTEHHGIQRVVFIGPKAQEVLKPFLEGKTGGEYLFSPKEGMAYFRAMQRQNRKTKVQPSQTDRSKRSPKRTPTDHYSTDSYASAVERACIRAGVPHWHPNQLRHTAATEIRREAGIDAARAQLGHSSPAVTEIYAEIDMNKAAEVMARLG